jgi:copper chaperone CopZ
VARALEELPGIKKGFAVFPEKKAVVTYDPALVAVEEMCQALFKSGYVAGPKTNDRPTSAVIPDESREKSKQTDDRICYCFGYTRDDIEQDFVNNGRSLIMEKIAAEKKAGGCDCGDKNPKGK